MSALVVNYRSYVALDQCLRSLGRQSCRIEVIVVDQSTDAEALDPLRETFRSVAFVASDCNDGFGGGVNRAARSARGEYLLVLNPDVVVSDDAVERMVRWLDDHPRTGIVAPLVRSGDGTIEGSARAFPGWSTVLAGRSTWLSRHWPTNPLTRRNVLTGPAVQEPVDVDWVSGACMLVRRTAYDAVAGFDEGFFLYWEDADLCRRIREAGWTITYLPHSQVEHMGGQSSQHAQRAAVRAFHHSVFRYFLKHGGPLRYALAPFVFVALQVRLGVNLARAGRQKQ